MGHNKQEKLRHSSAMVLSCSLHGLMLLGTYYLRVSCASEHQAWEERRIAINIPFTQGDQADKTIKPALSPPHPQQPMISQYTKASLPDEPTDSFIATSDSTALTAGALAENIQPDIAEQESAKCSIDTRGLYKINENREAGALLELAGWIWDHVPEPQDNTRETGKLVFEIQVDDLGEVVAVETIEKTVSPWVEQIYKEALVKLTFSKTTQDRVYTPISTGKVTFILQAK